MKTIYKVEKMDKLSPIAITIVALSIVSAVYYASYLINHAYRDNVILYFIMLFIELYVIVTAIFAWWTIMFHNKGNEYYKIKYKNDLHKVCPSIAVIIPVYSEPLDIIEKTIKAATELRLSPRVYVGDDGKRSEIAEMAERYGAIYVTRQNNKHFKSGNVNNVLNYITEEYVAVFDGDHIPHPNFFMETLPYFEDSNVGFVQTPQFYTNTDNIISKGASGAQNIFYELIMPGKNSFNSAFCVGTNVVFRKAALEDCLDGGIYLSDHSEDIWTSLILHENGWKSVYIPQVLAKGLAPDNLVMFFKQQDRWARGGYSILFQKNPLFSKNLQIEQRLQYFFSTLHYFSGFVIFLYLLVPVIFLMSGIKPIHSGDSSVWALHFVPFLISKFLLMFYLMDRFDMSIITTSIALFPIYIKAFFSELFGKNFMWVVTNTSIKQEESIYSKLTWHFFFALLSLVAIVTGLLTLDDRRTVYMFSMWAFLNAFYLLHFIKGAIKAEKQPVAPKIINTKLFITDPNVTRAYTQVSSSPVNYETKNNNYN